MTKIECVSCGELFDTLDGDGICESCNLEDYCTDCNQHEIDCICDEDDDDDDFIYGFDDDDFGDEDDYNEEDDWEGDKWDEEDDAW